MTVPVGMRASAHNDDIKPTRIGTFRWAIMPGTVICGILLAIGFALFLFGPDSTIDATIGFLSFGAIVSLGAVVCLRTFGRTP